MSVFSTKDAQDVLEGREFLEVVSKETKKHVMHKIRMKAIEICHMRLKQDRFNEIDKCPLPLRGYLEKEVVRVWKIKIDNSKP